VRILLINSEKSSVAQSSVIGYRFDKWGRAILENPLSDFDDSLTLSIFEDIVSYLKCLALTFFFAFSAVSALNALFYSPDFLKYAIQTKRQ